ncbi:proline iminopeptidase [Spongiibacter sp. IMCC21906]|uniref:prolyl aminopeptidase n=1 Tax=Spongiibacter sp. IMCC21906 TaxID=1620392 RepID=UPI00062E050B|nr:prolyl aminopeptidase [Spongiibacter sp. IMCC21906]AKH68529.1 proline iminopeptidase [Spongiibacter sp. IMCC21906]
MQALYPDIKPFRSHHMAVEPPHILYVEEAGNPDGIPVVFLHGGPGAGLSPKARCFFDPERYRIILFDQRGSGRSEPHACLENNTTQGLITDMEVIRDSLGIERWILFGGSWGSTLALAYAQCYPERVNAMILRGIFLCRLRELNWFYCEGGASRIFPDYWQDFTEGVVRRDKESWIEAYHRALHADNEVARMAAAKAWSQWEARCSTLRPNHDIEEGMTSPHAAVSMSHIETHYFMNGAFLEENQLLKNMDRIAHIPGIIVHGRYDMICPLENAVEVHRRWLAAELHVVRDAGHSAYEPSIADALVKATNDIADMFDDVM